MSRRRVPAVALLFTPAASPLAYAGPAVQLPDMSSALQSRIDRQESDIPSRHASEDATASAWQFGTARRGTRPDMPSGSGCADEPAWKPYHSAM